MISFQVFYVHFFLFSGIGASCFEKALESVQNPIWAQLQPLGCYAHCFLHRIVNQRCSRLQLQSRLHQWTFKWEGLPWHGECCFKNGKAVWLTAKGLAYAKPSWTPVWFNDFMARSFYLTRDMLFSWMMQTKPTRFSYVCIYMHIYICLCFCVSV